MGTSIDNSAAAVVLVLSPRVPTNHADVQLRPAHRPLQRNRDEWSYGAELRAIRKQG